MSFYQVRGLGALTCTGGMPLTFFSFLRVVMEYEMNLSFSASFPFTKDPVRSAVDRAARRVAWACQIALDSSYIFDALDNTHGPCPPVQLQHTNGKKKSTLYRKRRSSSAFILRC